jgi:hypothetical protein
MTALSVTATVTDSTGQTGTATATATVNDAPTARFPGDPGPGKLWMGLNDPPATAQGTWQAVEAAMPAPGLSAHRLYSNGNWSLPVSDIAAAISRGQIPVVSIGYAPYGNPQDVPASAVTSLAQQLMQFKPNPVYLVPGLHEPEDNTPHTGTGAATTYDLTWAAGYRSTGRALASAIRSAGGSHVTIVGAAYMNCTASGGCPGRDWRWWHLDWKGTTSGTGGNSTAADWYTGASKVVQVEAMDIYVPLIGTTIWTPPQTQMDTLLNAMTADGYTPGPLAILELGVKSDTASTPIDYTRGPGMMQNAFDGLIARGGVGIIWWTTGGNSFWSGPTPGSDPDDPGDPDSVGEREEKLKALVADPRHFHL